MGRKAKGESEFECYKRTILKASKQLGYGEEIAKMITEADCENDIIRAMITGRHTVSDDSAIESIRKEASKASAT